MKQKIWTVVVDWAHAGFYDIELKSFACKKSAQSWMKKDYDKYCREYKYDTCEESEDCLSTYEDGYYLDRHCTWTIHENEVNP